MLLVLAGSLVVLVIDGVGVSAAGVGFFDRCRRPCRPPGRTRLAVHRPASTLCVVGGGAATADREPPSARRQPPGAVVRQQAAHALLAVCIGGYEYDWRKAERHWRLAMAREPVSRDVLFWYGNHYLLPVGRTFEAIDAMESGLQGDPLNLLYRHHYARGLRLAGRLGDAEVELQKILEIDEHYPHALGTLGSVCAQRGKYEEALVLTEKAHASMPWPALIAGQLAAILLRTGAENRAGALIETLKPGTASGAPSGLAVFHALCGDLDQAAEWAERAIEQRDMPLVQNLGPFLRPTPWWPVLARRMNLPG
jgi:Flp pilus assembly protein TadD